MSHLNYLVLLPRAQLWTAQCPVTVMAGCLKIFSDFTLTNIETESLATQPDASESYKGHI